MFLWGPYNEAHRVLGSTIGVPLFGQTTICVASYEDYQENVRDPL